MIKNAKNNEKEGRTEKKNSKKDEEENYIFFLI